MATMDRISSLYTEFRCAALTELISCYELLDLRNDGGNWIVAVPHKTAAKRLRRWFDNNNRPNDRLETIKAAAALELLLEKGDFSYDTIHGCQFIDY